MLTELNIKKAQALVRFHVKYYKKESRNSYVSTISSRTLSKEIFGKIKSLNGQKRNQQIRMIRTVNGCATDPVEICNTLAEHFKQISEDDGLNTNFLKYKSEIEKVPLFFPEDNNSCSYNSPFSMFELKYALSECKNSAPGPDNIQYEHIKHLNSNGFVNLLNIYNRIWTQRTFPENWKKSFTIPIPKIGKDFTIPTNIRPINLTNCLSKVFEKMINKRLAYTLEKENMISNFQSGFRKNRSTIDNLTFLEQNLITAFNEGKSAIGIFFDMEKAFDRTWHRFVITALIELGFKGNMLYYINNLLRDRKFQVIMGETKSDTKDLANGIIQGSVLSCNLFIVAVNKIFSLIDTEIRTVMYADDLCIIMSHKKH